VSTPDVRPRLPPESTNPQLPVLAESVWTSAEGLSVTMRYAIHAVRRIPGATVLDWSVTPLNAPGLAYGDDLPGRVDLGLSRESARGVDIVLIDPAERVYRPLYHRDRRQFNRCLCSPLWAAQLSLRLGETRLLQVTFPTLPETVSSVDVALAQSIPFWSIPVTPTGQVLTASMPEDLGRAPVAETAVSPTTVYDTYRGSRQRRQGVQVQEVVSGSRLTSVRWTLSSITDQPSLGILPYGLPLSAELPLEIGILTPGSASGLQLRSASGSPPMRSQLITTAGAPDRRRFECLCTHLGLWASGLREAGGRASLVTNFPALPAGTTTVDLILPTVGTIRGLAVTEARQVRYFGPLVAAPDQEWRYQPENPPRGWLTSEWPTPPPAGDQLDDYAEAVETLVTPPGW
jgi:hypothetical protein